MTKCCSMRELWPEAEEYLAIFQNTDPIIFVWFISLFLTYCFKEGIKGNTFCILNLKVFAMRHLRTETGESLEKY